MKSYKVIDDHTLEVRTNGPDAFLPYQIGWVMISSPAQWEKVGKDWNKLAQTPSGTGPWKVAAFAPQTRAELVPFKDYWDAKRVPKLDKLVLLPRPEATRYYQEPVIGRAARAGAHHLRRRPSRTRCCRRCTGRSSTRRSSCSRTRDVAPRAIVGQGDRLRPGPELVPGLLADHDEVVLRVLIMLLPARQRGEVSR